MSGAENQDRGETDELVERAADGNLAALEALLREHAVPIATTLLTDGALRREMDENDLVQVSSIEAILRIGTLETRTVEGFRAWFRTLAKNNLRDVARAMQAVKRNPGGRRITHGADGSSARTLFHSIVGEGASPSAIVDEDEQVSRMMEAMQQLPGSYARVIQLFDLEEGDVETVAAMMGRSKGAIHMLRMRAHARLRELL